MLSFANFGNVRHAARRAGGEGSRDEPDTRPRAGGGREVAADAGLVPELARTAFPHSRIQGDGNVVIFPDLQSGSIAYKLMQNPAGAEVIGPILMGLNRPVNLLIHASTVSEVVNRAALTAVTAELPGSLRGRRNAVEAGQPELVGA